MVCVLSVDAKIKVPTNVPVVVFGKGCYTKESLCQSTLSLICGLCFICALSDKGF